MKKVCAVISSLLIPALLTSCGNNNSVVRSQTEQTVITLSWWGNDIRNEYTIEAVSVFEKLHPDIKVKCSYSEWSGYEARSRMQMISGTEADVMQINFDWISEYSPDGTGYYDLDRVGHILDLSNYSEEFLEYGVSGGTLNAIPIAMNSETIYINKTVFDSLGLNMPRTWDDIFETAEKLRGENMYLLSGASKSIWLYAITYAEQVSGKKFIENDKIAFGEEELKIMIEFYKKLVDGNVIPQVEFFGKDDIDNGRVAGNIAWISDAQNYFGNIIEDGTEMAVADYTAFSPEDSGVGWYAKPATMYAISKNTEHPEESAILLDYLVNSPEMAELQGVEKGIPISTSARQHLDKIGKLSGLQYEASLKMEGNEKISKMHPLMEESELIEGYISACNLLIYGKADADGATKELIELFKPYM